MSGTVGHGYFISNACYLPPFVLVVYYVVTVVYYPALVAYHPVLITYLISATLCINRGPSALQNRQSSHPDCLV